ncbi:MAG: hypothetical protein H0X29_12040 [Parachlamydiaceae bacterium]|nr:hypothetical protein [Parachlamydiaceae bacterium]
MSFSDELAPITPINFFQITADCHYLENFSLKTFPSIKTMKGKHIIPDTSALCGEKAFAQVAIGWHAEGIEFRVNVHSPFKRARYPEVDRGDSFEVFIDTRDVKSSGFNTRFCHHFFFLAEAIEGQQAGEITRFRTEDSHPLCDPNDLKVKAQSTSSEYTLNIFIPNHCLNGYDPAQFSRLGFSYRINRADGFPQHFTVVTEDYQVDQQPSLWGTLRLVKT